MQKKPFYYLILYCEQVLLALLRFHSLLALARVCVQVYNPTQQTSIVFVMTLKILLHNPYNNKRTQITKIIDFVQSVLNWLVST